MNNSEVSDQFLSHTIGIVKKSMEDLVFDEKTKGSMWITIIFIPYQDD